MSEATSLIGLAMGIISFLGGLILWYRGSVEKSYAAQRDFGHLKNNYQSLATAIDQLSEQVDTIQREVATSKDLGRDLNREVSELNRAFVETRALILNISTRIEGLSSKIDVNPPGWRSKSGDS